MTYQTNVGLERAIWQTGFALGNGRLLGEEEDSVLCPRRHSRSVTRELYEGTNKARQKRDADDSRRCHETAVALHRSVTIQPE